MLTITSRLLQLPSPETIARYSRITHPNKIEVARATNSAYDHARYLDRKERNKAKGLGAGGKPLKSKTRHTWPELKGLIGKEYKRAYNQLNA
jgi:hypothetical protein